VSWSYSVFQFDLEYSASPKFVRYRSLTRLGSDGFYEAED